MTIHGAKVSRSEPSISHLLLADDSLLFCKAKVNEVKGIKDTLDNYCFLSRKLVNFDKSATYFSKGTILGVRLMMENERYLENPLIINKNKNISFQSLVGKFKNRIMSWQTPLLSQAGRSTLIKSAASPIPICKMSMLQLP